MILNILILLIGLSLLLYSADQMIGSGDLIAKKFSLPPILIGLTIIAFGTSAPELVVTIIAASKTIPATDAIVGNIIGSNIANILLVLGVSSFFFKINLSKIRYKDNIYLFIITAYFSILFYLVDEINLYHSAGFIFLIILFLNQLRNYEEDQRDNEINKFSNLTYLKLIISFVGIFVGGKVFLDSSLNIFTSLGLEQTIIGISILAIGTSLPELATVVISYVRKKGSIGIGNVIGSNIMNILFVFLPGILIVQSRNLNFFIPDNILLHVNILILSTLIVLFLSLFKFTMSKFTSLIFIIFYTIYICSVIV
jgi:cation:H+ antiporter